ncbi:helix-turn-helix transcriptional regulator [Paraliomyxa miuraensis]|uniref:helix-turn-helix transcriptional regulator n=1 Tax=Paraliomyxa miuraensis TaxID=376150 RepID=UPI00389B1ABA
MKQASGVVGLSPSTLNTLRSRGGGPPYVKMGRRVFYRVADLRAWRDARLRSSTAG